jgi:hypothetical protein
VATESITKYATVICLSMMMVIIIIMSMLWDYVSELRPPSGLLFIPRWYMSMESHGGMILTGENSWLVHQSSLAILPAESSSSKQEIWEKGMRIWPFEVFLFILASDFYTP